jgi:hypothetical protein
MTDDGRVSQIGDLVEAIRPIFAGYSLEVQGAVLADLVAMWLADHQSIGDPQLTAEMREGLLNLHIEQVRDMMQIREQLQGDDEGNNHH